jgi:hypothetical protein
MCRFELDIGPGVAESAVGSNSTLDRYGLGTDSLYVKFVGYDHKFPHRRPQTSILTAYVAMPTFISLKKFARTTP